MGGSGSDESADAMRSRSAVRVPPRGCGRMISILRKSKYLPRPLVGARKFTVLTVNLRDAQFVAPPVRRGMPRPLPRNREGAAGFRLVWFL